jgi:hypothetical protein
VVTRTSNRKARCQVCRKALTEFTYACIECLNEALPLAPEVRSWHVEDCHCWGNDPECGYCGGTGIQF